MINDNSDGMRGFDRDCQMGRGHHSTNQQRTKPQTKTIIAPPQPCSCANSPALALALVLRALALVLRAPAVVLTSPLTLVNESIDWIT